MAELSDILEGGGWPKEEPKKPKKPKVVIDIKDYALEAILSAVLGLYAAFVFWDVWSIGVKGLGFNATIFIYALTALLVVTRTKERLLAFRDLTWIAPSLVIGLSFSLYENDFFEPINCFIFPALLIWNFVVSSDHFWDRFLGTRQVFTDVLTRIGFVLFGTLTPVWHAYLRFVTTSSRLTRSQAIKITEGVALLLGIFIVVLPLLYSSDRIFAFLVEHLRAWFGDLILENLSIFVKVPYAGLVTVLLLGICIRSKPQTLPVDDPTPKALDAIISGIVLSGLLTLYLAYLFAQFEQLWNKTFSFAPSDISSLADTGVWQLFIISIINVVGFHLLRRRTNRVIRILLPALAVVSVLVLGPTIYKTYLYISWTGLNYETFYVSSLVLFFVALLIFLCFESFRKNQSDIAKKAVIIFSVMYSAVAVFPVSQLAYAVNTELAKSEDASQWLQVGIWKEYMSVPADLPDTEELLSPAVADIAKETENLKDFRSLLEIIHQVDSKEVKETQWCVQLTDAPGDARLRIGHQCVADSTHTEEHGKAWVVDVGDIDNWQAGAKSSFAKSFRLRSTKLRHFRKMNEPSTTSNIERKLWCLNQKNINWLGVNAKPKAWRFTRETKSRCKTLGGKVIASKELAYDEYGRGSGRVAGISSNDWCVRHPDSFVCNEVNALSNEYAEEGWTYCTTAIGWSYRLTNDCPRKDRFDTKYQAEAALKGQKKQDLLSAIGWCVSGKTIKRVPSRTACSSYYERFFNNYELAKTWQRERSTIVWCATKNHVFQIAKTECESLSEVNFASESRVGAEHLRLKNQADPVSTSKRWVWCVNPDPDAFSKRPFLTTVKGCGNRPQFLTRAAAFLASLHLRQNEFFLVGNVHLLVKPEAPQAPKAVEQEFVMLWHQKSFQAFKIEQELEVFRKKQTDVYFEALEKFSTLKKSQKTARDKWRHEISEIGPQSVFTKVIE